jgi:hypothetical protein
MNSCNSITALNARIEAALHQGKVNFALQSIHDVVEQIITEPSCTAQVFFSRDLDELCLRIGIHNLASLTLRRAGFLLDLQNRAPIIYLVSRLQRSGGHSQIVQDFIRSQPDKNHLILSTEIAGPSDKRHFANKFTNIRNVQIEYAPRGNLGSRLAWLQSKLLECQPEYVHLLNHHQDSVAVAAVVPSMGLNGGFYHHGDHHLCLGVTIRHLEHIDLHPMGYHYCREELGLDNKYLPLTIEDKGIRNISFPIPSEASLTTATVARSNKIEIPYYVSYLDLVPRILSATGGRHIHIGKLTPWALRRMYSQMKQLGVDSEKLMYIEWTPSVWESLKENSVDLYLASFPYGAGLTLVEVQGAGIPVVLHQHLYSRVLSGLEMAYPEAFSWSDPEALIKHLAMLNRSELEAEGKLARKHYEDYHSSAILKDYFRDQGSLKVMIPPLHKDYKPRWDEWAVWVVSQKNIFQTIYKFAYRAMRKIRHKISMI